MGDYMERAICQVPRTAKNDLDEFFYITLTKRRAHESRLRFRFGQILKILTQPYCPRSRSPDSTNVVHVGTARSRGSGGTQDSENLGKYNNISHYVRIQKRMRFSEPKINGKSLFTARSARNRNSNHGRTSAGKLVGCQR